MAAIGEGLDSDGGDGDIIYPAEFENGPARVFIGAFGVKCEEDGGDLSGGPVVENLLDGGAGEFRDETVQGAGLHYDQIGLPGEGGVFEEEQCGERMGAAEAKVIGYDFDVTPVFKACCHLGHETPGGAGAAGDGSSEEGDAELGLGGESQRGDNKTQPWNPALHFDGQFCYPNKSVSSRNAYLGRRPDVL